MRKLQTFLIALVFTVGVTASAIAQMSLTGAGGSKAVVSGGAPVYSNAPSGINNGCPSGPVTTCTIAGFIVVGCPKPKMPRSAESGNSNRRDDGITMLGRFARWKMCPNSHHGGQSAAAHPSR